jgi:hypothetical protein
MTFKNPDILSNAPYYDDFNEAKNFLRTLFKPGYAVQARELTQLQTVLQSQISRFADHIFADGSQVFGGKVFVTDTNYVRVEKFIYDSDDNITTGSTETVLEGLVTEIPDETVSNDETYSSNRLAGTLQKTTVQVLRGGSSTGTVLLNHYIPSFNNGSDDYPVIFFADTTGNEGILPGDLLRIDDTTCFKVITPTTQAQQIYTVSPSGKATLVKVDAGIYYVDGMFVRNNSQILVPYDISAAGQAEQSYETGNYNYSNVPENVRLFSAPSARVGLYLNRQVVTVDDDTTLRDPSNGIYNANAPGADRYKISLDITQYPYDPQDVSVGNYANQDFIQIARIVQGRLDWIRILPNYSQILDLFARRTFDESGSYTVRPFALEIKNHLRNDVYVYVVKSTTDENSSQNFTEIGSYIWTAEQNIDPRVSGFNFENQTFGIGEVVGVVPFKELEVGVADQTQGSTSKLIYVKLMNNKRIDLGDLDANSFGTVRYARSSTSFSTSTIQLRFQNFVVDKNGTYSPFDIPEGDSSLMNLAIQPGKAYVYGYESELFYPKNVDYDKGLDLTKNTQTQTVNLNSSSIMGNYLVCSFANDTVNAIPNWETLPKFELQTSDIMTMVIEESDLVQATAPIIYWSPFKYWTATTDENTKYMKGLPSGLETEQHESVIFIEEA